MRFERQNWIGHTNYTDAMKSTSLRQCWIWILPCKIEQYECGSVNPSIWLVIYFWTLSQNRSTTYLEYSFFFYQRVLNHKKQTNFVPEIPDIRKYLLVHFPIKKSKELFRAMACMDFQIRDFHEKIIVHSVRYETSLFFKFWESKTNGRLWTLHRSQIHLEGRKIISMLLEILLTLKY